MTSQLSSISGGKSSVLLSLACLIVIVAGMKSAAAILNPVFLAIFIAITCWPLQNWLTQKGVPTALAIVLLVLGMVIVVTLLGAYIGVSVQRFTRALPEYQANLREQTAGLVAWLSEHGVPLAMNMEIVKEFNAAKLMSYIGVLLSGLGGMFANMFFILLTVTFLLLEASLLPLKIAKAFGNSGIDEHSLRIMQHINRYLAIKALTSAVTGCALTLWLWWFEIDFAVLWGIVAFMLNFVPNIGSIIAAIPAVLLALVQADGATALWVAVGYVVVNTVIGNFWEPKIMGHGLGLSTLVVFLSLTFWGWLFGTVGMLLSVPFTMIAKIILESQPHTRWIAVLLSAGQDLQTEGE